jgi:acyl-coenzyme A thioesterase PaaI-like protein
MQGGEPFAGFIEAFRSLLDVISVTNPPEALWSEARGEVQAVNNLLEPWSAAEHERPARTRVDLPGRGNPLLVPFVCDETSDFDIRGHVTFRPAHMGGNNAAHGGMIPLLFDEVLGRLSNSGDRGIARTAFLHVNFRHVATIGHELQVEGTIDRVEGRKRWATGRLTDGATLVADAEALFVELLPHQP